MNLLPWLALFLHKVEDQIRLVEERRPGLVWEALRRAEEALQDPEGALWWAIGEEALQRVEGSL